MVLDKLRFEMFFLRHLETSKRDAENYFYLLHAPQLFFTKSKINLILT